MNPEASFYITAKDETAAAFASADKGLRQFQRTAQGMKNLLASFGVIFSARAFAGWIQGALDVKNMTEEQLAVTKQAREALEGMKTASDELARSIASGLTPAMQGVSAVLTGWNRLLTGADPFPFEAQINALEERLHGMRVQAGASLGMPKKWQDEFAATIAQAEQQLAELKRKQEQALGVGAAGGPGQKPTQIITQDEWVRLESFLYDMNQALAKRPPLITQDELVALETFIYELNKKPEFITQDELIRLETFLNELNEKPPMITQEEWVNLESFLYELNNVKDESLQWAEDLGRGLKSAFSDWLVDGEMNFKSFLKRLAAEWATSQIFSALSAGLGGAPGGVAKFFGQIFGGSRDTGGPVSTGKIYEIGKGPYREYFSPGSSGFITPRGGGGDTIHVHVAPGVSYEQVAMAVEQGYRAAVETSTSRTFQIVRGVNRPAMA